MAKLIDYDKQTKKERLKGTIPSGIKSGDSSAELMMVEPLIRHPEIDGLFRAFDPQTNWKGWVEYTPPPITPPVVNEPTQQEIYEEKRGQLRQAKIDLDLGIINQEEYNTILTEVKALKDK